MPPRLTTKIFIQRSKKKHPGKYDYSLTVYEYAREKVIIICPTHGKFWQTPDSHTQGHGCDKCVRDAATITKPHTLEMFITKAQAVWGDRWGYSEAVYVKNSIKVKIICPEHGVFKQTPDSHTSGKNGCDKCVNAMLRAKYQANSDDVIKQFRAVWGDTYGYGNMVYVNTKTPILITCKVHNKDFKQAPYGHLSGQGCPACGKYGFNSIAPARLYYLRVENRNQLCYKIGVTNNELTGRYFGSDWDKITVLLDKLYDSGSEAKEEEDRIKEEFKAFKYTGEKLLIGVGTSELFTKDVLLLDHHN